MTVLKPPALIQYSVLSSNLGKGIVPVLFRYSPTTNSPAISSCFSTAKYVVDINSWPPHKHHRRFERSQRCATRSENPFKLLLPPAVKGRTRCTNKSSWLGHLDWLLVFYLLPKFQLQEAFSPKSAPIPAGPQRPHIDVWATCHTYQAQQTSLRPGCGGCITESSTRCRRIDIFWTLPG